MEKERVREPISIYERAQAQEAEAQGKEWKPDPEPKESKEPKAEPKAPESKVIPEHDAGKAAPGNMPWNRRA